MVRFSSFKKPQDEQIVPHAIHVDRYCSITGYNATFQFCGWFVGLCAFREPLKIFLYSGQLAGELTELILWHNEPLQIRSQFPKETMQWSGSSLFGTCGMNEESVQVATGVSSQERLISSNRTQIGIASKRNLKRHTDCWAAAGENFWGSYPGYPENGTFVLKPWRHF